MAELLKINKLSIAFPGTGDVVRRLSLGISTGETVGVVGESGAGKSLTAWSVTGAMPLNTLVEGSIEYFDVMGEMTDLLSDPAQRRQIVGKDITIIPQNPMTSLNPALKCGEQVREMLRHTSESKETQKQRVLKAFSDMSFSDPQRVYAAYPMELSGGQLQRVVMTMATITNPRLLIADEPTTALDTITQSEVLRWLRKWSEEKERSILFISHDLAVLSQICDRICVVERGEMVAMGSIAHLTRVHQSTVVNRLLDHRPENLKFTGIGEMKSMQRQGLLEVSSMSKTYRSPGRPVVVAVNELSFSVSKGECVGLVGSTGCGKSTVARILTGLTAYDHGQIQYNGLPLDYKKYPSLRGRIQMVFQDPYSALYPHQTVERILAEPLRLHQGIKGNHLAKMIAHLLEKVGLPDDYLGKFPDELSGGERQRVQIARALSVKPEFLICDECVSGLDMPVQAKILGLLHSLRNDTGVAILFISHDLAVVRCIADRLLVMDSGSIVEEGDTHVVFNKPQHPVTKAMIQAIPNLEI